MQIGDTVRIKGQAGIFTVDNILSEVSTGKYYYRLIIIINGQVIYSLVSEELIEPFVVKGINFP